MDNYKVYKYTNLINGKIYIGQTKQPTLLDRSDGSNGYGYKGCPLFYNAIKKYGFDKFKPEILADNLTHEEADRLEQYYIAKYNTTDDKHGYNLTKGGQSSSIHNKKSVICIETGEIYNSVMEAGQVKNINYRMISECCNHSRGYKSAGGYHWAFYDENGQHEKITVKKVLCIETGKKYNNCAEAARDLGLANSGMVSRVCNGTRRSTNNLHFKYIEEEVV